MGGRLSDRKRYSSSHYYGDRQFRAGGPWKGTCQGDSGGPLVQPAYESSPGNERIHNQLLDHTLVGIVSYGDGWDRTPPDSPGVCTEVSTCTPWIRRIAGYSL
ncbi:trypsin-like serine protease [Streptomyces clavuligerus]|uniref:Putative serine protease n=1 Tax=Streptomyces clavuligerus TaxID=1901 RepID=B5GVT1_STRCL|nr:trypsin-like serine protease [Streptomyces clavuligerus]EDY50427.1 hypothetical protein SSCG_03574 [Streptomyces clavuligerus]EFG03532.1 putative serine protease [Streptomyces clavuligerus]MBY6307882.1 trypsin-like serine protease [Streptomyces clavuligerus]QCS09565.1 serine protease [Streptomyces clavuligerus]QPJ98383.1 trypsin-like serine protease [Streptomyces clavuligerus]